MKNPALAFPKGDHYEIAKIHWQNLKKSSSPEPLGWFQSNLAQSIDVWMGFNFVQRRTIYSHKDNNGFFSSLNQRYDIIICVYWFELFSQVSDVAHGPLVSFW